MRDPKVRAAASFGDRCQVRATPEGSRLSLGGGAGILVAEQDLDFFAPGIVYSDENAFDVMIEVPQEFIGCGMEAEGG